MSKENARFSLSSFDFDAVIFDLDGVITDTARVHAAAWKEMLDTYLKERAEKKGGRFHPFDPEEEYRRYVDGKPRYEGVRDFLAARDIDLPYGSREDSPDRETICGLGNRKNELFHKYLREEGVDVYESTINLITSLRSAGIQTAVVSSSRNCEAILKAANIIALFDDRVDGRIAERLGLKGKPSPDIFTEAARRLQVNPARAVVVEDATAGVRAAEKGGFGLVIGVDREGHPDKLRSQGADFVVRDLSEVDLRIDPAVHERESSALPSALQHVGEIGAQEGGRRVALFLDYDGTLTPIVQRPEDAVLSDEMREVIRELGRFCTVAVISGRDLRDVQERVGLDGLYYAGSHGFEVVGSDKHLELQEGKDYLPALDGAEQGLAQTLKVKGARIERKKYSIAVHFREVSQADVVKVEAAVDQTHQQYPELRKSRGKKIIELQPKIDWDKGKAVNWLLDALNLKRPKVVPIYIGDDTTDEDAFSELQDRGIGIVVQEENKRTAAQYTLKDPGEVQAFLNELKKHLQRRT